VANRLKKEKQIQIVALLTEGCSIRSIERIARVHRDTVCRLLVRIGDHCEGIIDQELQSLFVESIQVDELWGFIHKKERRLEPGDPSEWGDVYTFLGMEPESKLICGFDCGKRNFNTTDRFMDDLSRRLVGKLQVATDAFPAYKTAVPRHFGDRADYMQVVKSYDGDPDQHRYSPPKVRSIDRVWIQGMPNQEMACTSHVERLNWSCRTYLRRLMRLSNGFSRKLENFRAAVALFICWYNWVKRHTSLRMTPAMKMGIAASAWPIERLLPN